MNNLLFEVEGEVPYYETIAGGAGAVKGCPGASGVQIHMTNTKITDPEILEYRHPGVRLDRFVLRKDSGGNGLYPGGEGIIREIKFTKARYCFDNLRTKDLCSLWHGGRGPRQKRD